MSQFTRAMSPEVREYLGLMDPDHERCILDEVAETLEALAARLRQDEPFQQALKAFESPKFNELLTAFVQAGVASQKALKLLNEAGVEPQPDQWSGYLPTGDKT